MSNMFEYDGIGNLMPTTEIDPLDIFHELDIYDDIMPRLDPTSPPAATPTVTTVDAGDGTGFYLSIDGYDELHHIAYIKSASVADTGAYVYIGEWDGDVTNYLVDVEPGTYFVKVESSLDGGGVSTVVELAYATDSDGEGLLTQLANAIAAELSITAFSVDVTVVQEYPPLRDIVEQRTMHMIVSPRSVSSVLDSRQDSERIYTVDVTLAIGTDRVADVDVDPISKVSEEVHTALERKTLISDPVLDWMRIDQGEFVPDEGVRYRVTSRTLTLSYIRYS